MSVSKQRVTANSKLSAADLKSADQDPIAFWLSKVSMVDYDKLYKAALRALSIPASCSPIERVFSHGGIIFRPYRSNLSDTKLSSLIFLKCNQHHIHP